MNPNSQIQMLTKQMLTTAISPVTGSFMMMFMMWLIGSSVSPITLMMFVTMIGTTITNLSNTNNIFNKFSKVDKSSLKLFKLIYIVCCFIPMAFVLYRFSKLGILPNKDADFIPLLEQRTVCFLFVSYYQ